VTKTKIYLNHCFVLFCILFINVNVFSQENTTDSTETQISKESEQPSADGALVAERLKNIKTQVPLTYNEHVLEFVNFFIYRRPSFTKSMLEKKDYFFPIFEKYLSQYNIPDEIKYLSLIESGLNPRVISYAGAAGLWQFMPTTGKVDFGLRIDKNIDERMHVEYSTVAACKYMRQLYKIFGDWELVLAAYNTGPGNVKRAIRKAGGGGFWEIYRFLHPQTRSYVPQYVAMIYMMHHAADHGIYAENYESIPPSTALLVTNYLNLKTLTELSYIPYDVFQKVNPHVLKKEIPANSAPVELRIPNEYYSYFNKNKEAILDSASKQPISKIIVVSKEPKKVQKDTLQTPEEAILEAPEMLEKLVKQKPKVTYHKVRKGENLSEIARKYGVNMYDIKAWNNLRKLNNVRVGQSLKIIKDGGYKKVKVPVTNHEEAELPQKQPKNKKRKITVEPTTTLGEVEIKPSNKKDSKEKPKEIPQSKKELKPKAVSHKVSNGDSYYSIAKQYNISQEALLEANNITSKKVLKSGTKLVIPAEKPDSQSEIEPKIEKNIKKGKTDNTLKEVVIQPKKVSTKFHQVKSGDTIWGICQKYEITEDELRAWNKIKKDNLLKGQKLKVSK
jgi:membrane-bound lytic murein transglycosylase D